MILGEAMKRQAVAGILCLIIFGLVFFLAGRWPEEVPEQFHVDIETELAEAIPDLPVGVVAAGARTPEELRAQFATDYDHGRKEKLSEVNYCEACGKTELQLKKLDPAAHLETHHVDSVKRIFKERLPTSLIGDPKNMIVLCRTKGGGHHFLIGHDPDGPGPATPNFQESNPNVRRDAAAALRKARKGIPVAGLLRSRGFEGYHFARPGPVGSKSQFLGGVHDEKDFSFGVGALPVDGEFVRGNSNGYGRRLNHGGSIRRDHDESADIRGRFDGLQYRGQVNGGWFAQ